MPQSSRLDARPPRLSESDPPALRCKALRAGGELARQNCGGQAPGILHHVMGRGIERKKIFIDKRHRQDFITRLAALAEDKSMDIYGWWALLPIPLKKKYL